MSFELNGTPLFYVKNMQGDITAIADKNGNILVEYVYDSWGKLITMSGPSAHSISNKNPFLYRGYYYDFELGLYYLNSRYYDPVTKRFINADSYVTIGITSLKANMFAYCVNRVINCSDFSGRAPGDEFNSIDEAAEDAAKYMYDLSFLTIEDLKNNKYRGPNVRDARHEYGATIFSNSNGKYTYVEVYTDYSETAVRLRTTHPEFVNIKPKAAVHTHPYINQYSLRFSSDDKQTAIDNEIYVYLYAGDGTLKKYDYRTGSSTTIVSNLMEDWSYIILGKSSTRTRTLSTPSMPTRIGISCSRRLLF